MSATDAPTTQHSLIVKLRKLEPHAWDEFVKLYDGLLALYSARCGRIVGLQDADCEDVKQDLLLKLLRTMPSFQPDASRKQRFHHWLWTVTYNVAVDWARKHRRRLHPPRGTDRGKDGTPAPQREVPTEDLGDLAIDPAPEPDQEVIEAHLWEKRRYILERVKMEMQSAKKWDCFEKHFLQKQRSADVAGALQMSVSAVNTYTARVLARIRELCVYYDVEL